MAHTTQNWQTYKPEIDAYIDDERATTKPGVHKSLFTVESTDRLQISEITYSGFGPMVSVGELGEAVEDSSLEGYRTNYVGQSYRKQAVFSSDWMETDQSGKIESIARGLPRTCEYTRDLNIMSVFRKAWDQTQLWGDSKSLISTAHPRKDGGASQYNTFFDGVQLELAYSNVIELENVLLSNVSNSGNVISVGNEDRNKILLVSPELREDAFQIAGVEGPDTEPDTADRNANYFRKGAKYDVLVTKFLGFEVARQAGEHGSATKTSSNYWDSSWFIIDRDMAKEYLKVYERQGYPKYDDEENKKNQSLIKYAYDKYAYGVANFLGIAGSKGDSSTFSS
jgi:hypothetical protein